MANDLREASRIVAAECAASAQKFGHPGESVEMSCEGLENEKCVVTIKVMIYLKSASTTCAQVA